jgi:4-hydroxybenzoate polyprenyltransferase/phosphoserine phosphatase
MNYSGNHTANIIAVDMDGTLLRADLSWELLVAYVWPAPWRIGRVLAWAVGGGLARLKARLADEVVIDGRRLPWNDEVVRWCESKVLNGGRVVLATASPLKSAREVTAHFGFIFEVLGSDEIRNFKAGEKADGLTTRFGAEGFDYVGNSSADVPVWRAAKSAFFVGNDTKRDRYEVELAGKSLVKIADGDEQVWRHLVRAVRPHQWLKNLLMLVPLLAAHRWDDTGCWRRIVPVLIAVCSVASAAYVINDLADLAADRRHPRKKERPFASGELSIPLGLAVVVVLLIVGLGLAWTTGIGAALLTLGYFGLSLVYSLGVKKMALVDVIWLSGMYTYRVIIGGAIIGVMVSPWLLAYSISLFLGLAFMKRYIELVSANPQGVGRVPGRGYAGRDAGWMKTVGGGASLASIVVLGLYLESPTSRALYGEPVWLWLVVLVMAGWLGRIWVMAVQKKVNDDPVWFAAKDPVTWVAAGLCGLALWMAGPLR